VALIGLPGVPLPWADPEELGTVAERLARVRHRLSLNILSCTHLDVHGADIPEELRFWNADWLTLHVGS
jgi:hypothetical protein